MNKFLLAAGSLIAAAAVGLGAFGAHALRSKLTTDQLSVYETGVRYQFYHAIAILICGILYEKFSTGSVLYSGYLFIAGILLFSGSLYLLSLKSLLGIESWKFLGPITPLGGTCMIAGWILLAYTFLKK